MHQRPRRPLSAILGAALDRCSSRLARRTGTLLLAAVMLGLAAGAAIAVPGLLRPGTPAGPATPLTVDAAATMTVPGHPAAGTPAGRRSTAGAGVGAGAGAEATSEATSEAAAAPAAGDRQGHHGDHRRGKTAADAVAAQAKNANCSLLVPADPLSAQGLATPYQLVATDRRAGACHEADADQSAFVEAAIYDADKHSVAIYHPLVVDKGDRPAVPPTPVSLPPRSTVGVWFGFNGDGLTLAGAGAGQCVNGLGGSIFGQFAYCGADAFFAQVNDDGGLTAAIPALGQARDGKPCPTTRDFSVVDQDQSDNLATAYRIIGGRMAQLTPQTRTQGTALTNGSDEGLLAKAIDPALGCTPWTSDDLNNPGVPTPALALNELSAAKWQGSPAALVPSTDPMVRVDDRTSTAKTNLYRAGVDMAPIDTAVETAQAYCSSILAVAPARLQADSRRFSRAASPTPDQTDLLSFLQNRLSGTLTMLGCRPADRATGTQAGARTANAGAVSAPSTPSSAATPAGSAANDAALSSSSPAQAATSTSSPATTSPSDVSGTPVTAGGTGTASPDPAQGTASGGPRPRG